MIFHVKFGETTIAPAVFNADCEAAILLDYIRKRSVKDTEAYAREKDALIRAAREQTTEELAQELLSHEDANSSKDFLRVRLQEKVRTRSALRLVSVPATFACGHGLNANVLLSAALLSARSETVAPRPCTDTSRSEARGPY